MSVSIRHIDSSEPFASYSEYLRRGWQCPLPLFPGKKHRPPTGFTGYNAKIPEPSDYEIWLDPSRRYGPKKDGRYGPDANICLRLHEISVNKIHKQIVGIDVDDYREAGDNGKVKTGGADLEYLESELGPLPPTVVSSARQAPSGIRLFLAPAGLRFHDKPMPSIEVIQKHHRYVNVSPSWNPDAEEQYLWWKETVRDGNGFYLREPFGIPDVWKDLADLPAEWVDYLSSGRTLVDVDAKMDTSSVEELFGWTDENFAGGYPCEHVRKVLGYWKKQIDASPSSHDKIVRAHWALTGDALAGHRGWHQAIAEIDRYWAKDVADRDKRDLAGMRAEIFRSQTGNLRKRKAAVESGEIEVKKRCGCPVESKMVADFESNLARKLANGPEEAVEEAPEPAAGDGGSGSGDGPDLRLMFYDTGRPVGDYEMSDDGNGDHFRDLYKNNAFYVPEWKVWAMWDKEQRLWVAEEGAGERAFRQVKYRQLDYASSLYAARDELFESLRLDGLEDSAIRKNPEYKAAAARAKSWGDWALKSGNVPSVDRALKSASNFAKKHASEFDANPNLVGVLNGVMILGDGDVTFREREREDYLTMAAPHDYVPLDEQRDRPDMREGVELLFDYFNKFIPDPELLDHLQMVLGYGMLGHNPARIAVFAQSEKTGTGKSTLINLIGAAMGNKNAGGYSATVTPSLFRDKELNAQLADVLSTRYVITSELGEDNYLHADVFKRIVSMDEQSAERKYGNDQIRGVPAFLPIIATNGAPTIKGADEATRFRMYVVPFDQQITDADPNAPVRLINTSGAAMFAWLVEGYRRYALDRSAVEDRNRWPAAVKIRKSEFSSHLSDINEFISQMLVRKEGASIPCEQVWDMWVEWCYRNNVKNDYSADKFRRKLTSNGIERQQKRWVKGEPPSRRYVGITARASRNLGPRTLALNVVDGDGAEDA